MVFNASYSPLPSSHLKCIRFQKHSIWLILIYSFRRDALNINSCVLRTQLPQFLATVNAADWIRTLSALCFCILPHWLLKTPALVRGYLFLSFPVVLITCKHQQRVTRKILPNGIMTLWDVVYKIFLPEWCNIIYNSWQNV